MCFFAEGNTGQSFSIDINTGQITTTKPLDFESYQQYKLTVAAYNTQNPHTLDVNGKCDAACQSTWPWVGVYVNVLDENDTPPSFEYGVYNVCEYLIMTR